MPGPPPKHPDQRRRRNADVPLLVLPAGGRRGKAPPWPLKEARKGHKAAEARVWRELWRTPQAVAWELLGWTRTVGRYARLLVEAEEPGALVSLCSEVRQLEDRLGLNPMSMLRLRWTVSTDEVAQAREARSDVRRLRAVDPAAG